MTTLRRLTTLAACALVASCGDLQQRSVTAPVDASAQSGPGLVVDPSSVGGGCDDSRDVASVSAETPWCSLRKAIEAAPGGSTIELREGTYDRVYVFKQQREAPVTIRPRAEEDVVVRGVRIEGASGWRVEGLRVIGPVQVTPGSKRVEVVRNDISPYGVLVRPGTEDVLIEGNDIHDIEPGEWPRGYGIWSGKSTSEARAVRLTIRGNRIRRTSLDAIFLGGPQDAVVQGNEIGDIRKPTGSTAHTDAMQVLGAEGLTIRSNRFMNSTHGLWAGRIPVRRLKVVNNIFSGFRGFAVQISDAPDVLIANNTFFRSGYGAALRDFDPHGTADRWEGEPTTNATVVNNIFEKWSAPRAMIGRQDHNLIARGPLLGRRDSRRRAKFVDPERGDFRLAPGSPGIDAGTWDAAPKRDGVGRRRVDDRAVRDRGTGARPYVDIGALERLASGSR